MSIHLKDQEPETWAEIIRICEQYGGTNASELTREIGAVKTVTKQTVHNWIKQRDIPFAGQPRVERKVRIGGVAHLKDRDPATWAEVLRVCQESANEGKSPSHAFGGLRHFGFSRTSLIGWIDAGLIPAYTRKESGQISRNKRYL